MKTIPVTCAIIHFDHKVLHQYPNFKINLIPFITEYVSGDLILKEHSDHVLVDKEELYRLDWAEADLPVLKEYIAL